MVRCYRRRVMNPAPVVPPEVAWPVCAEPKQILPTQHHQFALLRRQVRRPQLGAWAMEAE
jgi:hypothetical protein